MTFEKQSRLYYKSITKPPGRHKDNANAKN